MGILTPDRLDPPAGRDLAARLFPELATGAEWNLGRVRAVLSELGDPHRGAPCLHVGGTNGKGSVAAVCASVLGAAGHRVGLYTSPHLLSFAERFRVDGEPAAEERLLDLAEQARDPVVRHGLTFFEAATVLGFLVFREAEVDVSVIEVGLGGRLDATNVVDPAVAMVTNVAMDHSEYLGDTLEAIAREKAGIAKEGRPFVTTEGDPRIVDVLRDEAIRRGARFHHLDPSAILPSVESGLRGCRLTVETGPWGRLALKSPMVGRHQALNVALAVRALQLLDPPLRPGAAAMVEGVRRARWPGRVEVLSMDGRPWILDVGHNPAGIAALVATLHELDLPRPRVAVFGSLGDKDWRSMLRSIAGWADRIVLTRAASSPGGRGWEPAAALASRRLWSAGRVGTSVECDPALESALARAGEWTAREGSVVVTGSHYTVGGALELLGRSPLGTAGRNPP